MKHAPYSPSPMSRVSLAMLGVLLVMPATTRAADQTVLGSKLQVQDTSTPEKRKISLQAKAWVSRNRPRDTVRRRAHELLHGHILLLHGQLSRAMGHDIRSSGDAEHQRRAGQRRENHLQSPTQKQAELT